MTPPPVFDAKSCAVLTSIDEQSPDIALGVDHSMGIRRTPRTLPIW